MPEGGGQGGWERGGHVGNGVGIEAPAFTAHLIRGDEAVVRKPIAEGRRLQHRGAQGKRILGWGKLDARKHRGGTYEPGVGGEAAFAGGVLKAKTKT